MDLNAFYDVMLECGMEPPPLVAWRAYVGSNSALWPIAKDGEFIGGILFIGHTIHIAVKPEWHGRWVTKSILRAFKETWQHDVDIHAYPLVGNEEANNLVKRLGFKYKGRENQANHYVKEPTCLQQSLPQ